MTEENSKNPSPDSSRINSLWKLKGTKTFTSLSFILRKNSLYEK
jgi:hypothetical protein